MDNWYIIAAHFSGPNIDTHEILVQADNINDALNRTEEVLNKDEWVFSIQHEDTI